MSSAYFQSADEMQSYVLEAIFSKGSPVKTRGLQTLEVINVNLGLCFPRRRKTYNEFRSWKLPLAIGEFAWHVSGSKSVDFISYYAKQWRNFSTDGKVISESCYGHKIFGRDTLGVSQWENIVKLLTIDPNSRRAVLALYDPAHGISSTLPDVACVSTVQFLIRQGRLDAIVNMRSNDIIWGFPYDVYLFTMLQELLSLQLKVEIGTYYHNVGSMHIYERHFELGRKMLKAEQPQTVDEPKMENIEQLRLFVEYEEKIRNGTLNLEDFSAISIAPYWKEMLTCLMDYRLEKSRPQRDTTTAW